MSADRVFTFPGGVWLSRTLAKDKQIIRELYVKKDLLGKNAGKGKGMD